MSPEFKSGSNLSTQTEHPADTIQDIFTRALAWHKQGELVKAQALYQNVLQRQPQHFDALHFLAVTSAQLQKHDHAVKLFAKAAKLNPNHASLQNNFGNALNQLGRLAEAVSHYGRAIAINPNYAEAYNNLGNALHSLKRYQAALDNFTTAIKFKPNYAEAFVGLGNSQKALMLHADAIDNYRKALNINPYNWEAYNNLGNLYQSINQFDDALSNYQQAIAIKPELQVYINLGNTQQKLQCFTEALQSYQQAIACNNGIADGYVHCGHLLFDLGKYSEALQYYQQAYALDPNYPYLLGFRLHTKMRLCDWQNHDRELKQLLARVKTRNLASPPFFVQALADDPALQKIAAETLANQKYPANHALEQITAYTHNKIRIGYFSADFRHHPVAYLTAELFERHDKTAFEVTAFAYSTAADDDMTLRLQASFDQYINVAKLSDLEIAQLARSMEIDIAVDLGGFTTGSRTGIFSYRAAPLQLSYLGFLGTMGTDYMDYLIADAQIVSPNNRQHFSEKIISLPSYQANDTTRVISSTPTRAELGIPETGFIYCCLNNNYKITPDTFACWMRILKRVDGSVLLLLSDSESVELNLKQTAMANGVADDRLIFAKRASMPDYLARYQLADLFLDTLPYNAGATASDALWAGLPVLTCSGKAFAARVASSLLHALQLPELVCKSMQEYESQAIDLATATEKLAAVKQKLAETRLSSTLFNMELFSQNLEIAYRQIQQRHQAGLAPEDICL